MARKPYTPVAEYPYHITNRSNNKEWFDIPIPIVWKIFCDQISDSAERYSVWVHSFVLMSNHFHLMVRTPLGNLDMFLRHFLTETVRDLKKESGRINHFFGGRSSQSILDSPSSVAYVFKYIYRNPVRAGLCTRVQDYRYSSLATPTDKLCPLPIVEGIDSLWRFVPKEYVRRVQWLNLPTPKELEGLISLGLRRSHFRFSSSNAVRKDLYELAKSYSVREPDDPYLLGLKGE